MLAIVWWEDVKFHIRNDGGPGCFFLIPQAHWPASNFKVRHLQNMFSTLIVFLVDLGSFKFDNESLIK